MIYADRLKPEAEFCKITYDKTVPFRFNTSVPCRLVPAGPDLVVRERFLRQHHDNTVKLPVSCLFPDVKSVTRAAALPSIHCHFSDPTMATRTLQPSEYDIQREVEALRDIRRRSTTPGALTIDPDLPNQSPPSSPTAYRIGSPGAVSPFHQDSPGGSLSDESSVDSGSGSGASGSSGESSSAPNNPADDPFHLFWVPASLHPEIAPAEFRAFLKEHARSPPSSESSASLGRSDSSLSSSSSLGRKRSMLSRQYSPAEHDGVENEHVVPLRRNRSSLYTNRGPQLTINDLQRLEELAEEASESDDPSRLRNVLRRSLSLNISPSGMSLPSEPIPLVAVL